MTWDEQCKEMYPVPIEYKGSFQYANCQKPKGHDGPHVTARAYGTCEWYHQPHEEVATVPVPPHS